MRYAVALMLMALAIFFQPPANAATNLTEPLPYAAAVAVPSLRKRLRYVDLVTLGVVRNRVTLANWIRDRGFPPGARIGPNTRVWDEGEIEAWLAAAPTEPRITPIVKGRRGRPRKAESTNEITTA